MPDSNAQGSREKESGHHRSHKERIGNYVVGAEIGRGSFATVYKGYRSVSVIGDPARPWVAADSACRRREFP